MKVTIKGYDPEKNQFRVSGGFTCLDPFVGLGMLPGYEKYTEEPTEEELERHHAMCCRLVGCEVTVLESAGSGFVLLPGEGQVLAIQKGGKPIPKCRYCNRYDTEKAEIEKHEIVCLSRPNFRGCQNCGHRRYLGGAFCPVKELGKYGEKGGCKSWQKGKKEWVERIRQDEDVLCPCCRNSFTYSEGLDRICRIKCPNCNAQLVAHASVSTLLVSLEELRSES